jgi:hypothetical protein
MPLKRWDLPALLPLFCPKLEDLLPTELQSAFKERHRLIRQ